jgi:hypothetical protein
VDAPLTAEEEIFALALYLISCARLALEEPVIYGSFRLVEGASRLIETAPRLGAEPDDFLTRCREEIEREKVRMIDDADGYRDWLDGLLRQVVAEAARRNLADAG